MIKHTAPSAALLIAGALVSACGGDSPLENTTGPDESTARISATAGTGLGGTYGNYVTGVPQATLTDLEGQPLAGVTVTFEALGGGQVTGAAALTDSLGRASPTSWRLGMGGAQGVRASAPGARPITFTASASEPRSAAYRIQVRYAAGTTPTPAQRTAFESAAATWSRIILSGGAPYPVHEPDQGCGSIQGETVDGVVITADLKPIDGAGKILGSAGPCIVRDADYLPVLGYMQFDTDDLATVESRGQLEALILHEMGHVLGLGTLWEIGGATAARSSSLLLRTPSEDPTFTGAASRFALFGIAGAAGFPGAPVPVENTGASGTALAHWREAVFGQELMTGWLNPGATPLSALTVAQFRDLGYVVNDAQADSYTLTPPVAAQAPASAGGGIPLIEGRLTMPLLVINRAGRMVRSIDRAFK